MRLVIGYGNELRRDDGVGPLVARTVAGWGLPGVIAIDSHGLLPELAEELSRAERAVFVDAGPGERVEVREIAPGGRETLGHTGDPAWLLALTGSVYGRCPPAWLVTVPAPDRGFGEGLSPQAAVGMAAALDEVRRLAEP